MGVDDRAGLLGVGQQAAQVLHGDIAQAELPRGVVEGVAIGPGEALVDVHAGAGHLVHRLGHEARIQAVLERYGLHRQLEGHQAVGHGEGVVVAHVHLVLPGRDLVVGSLAIEAHDVEVQHDVLPHLLPLVQRHEVEVAGGIGRRRDGVPLGVQAEEEELELRSEVHGVALLLGLVHHLLQHPTGVALEPVARVIVDLAQEPRRLDAAIAGPWIDLEGGEDRLGPHVRFLDGGVAEDG